MVLLSSRPIKSPAPRPNVRAKNSGQEHGTQDLLTPCCLRSSVNRSSVDEEAVYRDVRGKCKIKSSSGENSVHACASSGNRKAGARRRLPTKPAWPGPLPLPSSAAKKTSASARSSSSAASSASPFDNCSKISTDELTKLVGEERDKRQVVVPLRLALRHRPPFYWGIRHYDSQTVSPIDNVATVDCSGIGFTAKPGK